MTFIIHGRDSGQAVTQTRVKPASAGVLAQKWMARGFGNVEIEWSGRRFDLPTFRGLFIVTRKGMKARSSLPVT